MQRAIVVTSINGLTDAIKEFLRLNDWELILVGDRKTPDIDRNAFENLTYLSIEDQKALPGQLDELPYNHYCRKNIGYQYAIQKGASVIADTDDDNIPKSDWEAWPSGTVPSRVVSGPHFVNVYDYFTDEFVWPRGLPLNHITTEAPAPTAETLDYEDVGIVQGLADIEPDVDAIFRLVFDREVEFDPGEPVVLDPGTYCPFNSQNTLWPAKEIHPYLYLPSTVSFRFTDILRGYVAVR